MELEYRVQNYDWGKIGKESVIAQMLLLGGKEVDEFKAYAELWLGTHPNGPSLITSRNVFLSEYLPGNVDAVGPEVHQLFGVSIPFLFKVLSIRKALSIQAHPNKEHAEILHREFPDIYKDSNHKPELAIALTDFEGLLGFRTVQEVSYFVENIPELRNVLSKAVYKSLSTITNNNEWLKLAFKTLMTADKSLVKYNLELLLNRLHNLDENAKEKFHYNLLQRLHNDYPGDVGCWSIYLLNYLRLKPGQAIFLGANVPHAYLSGDCIECMANSDNVVRAGLTPKFIDVTTLVSMIDYTERTPKDLFFEPINEDGFCQIWRPPIKDFAVAKIVLPIRDKKPYNTILRCSPSIFLVVAGEGTAVDTEPCEVKKGSALFLKSSRQLTLTISPDAKEDLIIFQAMCNVV